MKKRLAAVLALMMLLSLTIPALAQDDQPVVLEFMAISDWPDAVYPAIADALTLRMTISRWKLPLPPPTSTTKSCLPASPQTTRRIWPMSTITTSTSFPPKMR